MINCQIRNVEIAGISCVLPIQKVDALSRVDTFGEEAVNKIINKTGVKSIYKSMPEQTASDLAFVAAKQVIESNNISPDTIGALILVTQTPDYRLPATACVLQHRLGIPEECICFDINLGCSGYVNGLYAISALMGSGNINKALLLVAETPTKRISPLDRSLSMIFGDCGTATLLEYKEDASDMYFSFKTFGERFKKIIVPAGGWRNFNASTERVEWGDGNIRSDYDTYMNGQDVFSFTITEVPIYIQEFMNYLNKNESSYDYFILHQANNYILRQIAKKLKTDSMKVPISMEQYGNTSSTSIPLLLSFLKDNKVTGLKKCLMSGFGVGLSWAATDLTIDFNNVLPITHSDDYYTEGFVSHE